MAGITITVATGLAAGCTGSTPTPSTAPLHCCDPRQRAVPVIGQFTAVGGPLGAAPSPLSGRVTFLPAARGPGDGPQLKPVRVTVGRDGRFRVVLLPSAYDVVGRSRQFDGGHVSCELNRGHPRRFFGTAPHHVAVYCQRR